MKKSILEPCCKRYLNICRNYIDLTALDDESLWLIANLLNSVGSEQYIERKDLLRIAMAIESYLNKKLVREGYFFGRSLRECTFNEIDLQAEKVRIRNTTRLSLAT